MTNSGAKRGATSTTSQGDNKESKIMTKYLILPVIASVVVSVIVTNLSSPPSIQASAAHTFLSGYFDEVTHVGQRSTLYQSDLTSNFRGYPGVDWPSYNAFWKKWKSVSVNSVIPVAGNPLEFAATITYQPEHGNPFPDAVNFWLVCTGATGNLMAHVPVFGECPASDIKIDNEQLATSHQ
jgi:hypothetical protein